MKYPNSGEDFGHPDDGLGEYSRVRFTPGSGDEAFLGRVRGQVRTRRRRRAVAHGLSVSLGAVILLAVVLRGGLPIGDGAGSLPGGSWMTEATIPDLPHDWSLELDLPIASDSAGEILSRSVAAVFETGEVSDPVDYLSRYDDEVQERVLQSLADFDILSGPVRTDGEG